MLELISTNVSLPVSVFVALMCVHKLCALLRVISQDACGTLWDCLLDGTLRPLMLSEISQMSACTKLIIRTACRNLQIPAEPRMYHQIRGF